MIYFYSQNITVKHRHINLERNIQNPLPIRNSSEGIIFSRFIVFFKQRGKISHAIIASEKYADAANFSQQRKILDSVLFICSKWCCEHHHDIGK